MRRTYSILHIVAIPTILAVLAIFAAAIWAAWALVQIWPLHLVGLPWPVHIGYGIPH